MYGTIAKLKVRPGKLDELIKIAGHYGEIDIPGMLWTHLYQSEDDPNECWIAVAFDSKDAYTANADSPEQNTRYEAMRALLSADPVWNDGVVVQSVS